MHDNLDPTPSVHAPISVEPLRAEQAEPVTTAIQRKLKRLKAGSRARVLDLFSGCGGFMLGFSERFDSFGGVEFDPLAARSYANNFHAALQHSAPDRFAAHAEPRDIEKTDPERLVHLYQGRAVSPVEPATCVDIIIGGPPCPAFTRVGRAKLREVHNHPEAHLNDPRWKLYSSYLTYVEALQPLALVMENVPEILNFGGENIAEDICEQLNRLGYRCAYTLLNAASYGVPQLRERFFLVAWHRSLGIAPSFPAPTHEVKLPPGYKSSRHVAMKLLNDCSLWTTSHFVPTPVSEGQLPPPVTTAAAIGDLPALTGHRHQGSRRGNRFTERGAPYVDPCKPSNYLLKMRSAWGPSHPAPAPGGLLHDHFTRALGERDFRIFEAMGYGDEYPRAHQLAMQLFHEELQRRGPLSDEEREALQKAYVPPYDPRKFPNKWRKMHPDEPARTLMAHLGKDCYTHIHYDSQQARTLTVREAARLQSFPDSFHFHGTMNAAFRQIGNAVPPLLARALAEQVYADLQRATRQPS